MKREKTFAILTDNEFFTTGNSDIS